MENISLAQRIRNSIKRDKAEICYVLGLICGSNNELINFNGYGYQRIHNYHWASLYEDRDCLYLTVNGGISHTWLLIGRKFSSMLNEEARAWRKSKGGDKYLPIRFRSLVIDEIPQLNITKSFEFCTSEHCQRWGVFSCTSDNYKHICPDCLRIQQELDALEEQRRQEYLESGAYQRSLMTPYLREQILSRDLHTCQSPNCNYCNLEGDNLHIDHILPISRGGKTTPQNLQVLCAKCNHDKFTKTNQEWYSSMGVANDQ